MIQLGSDEEYDCIHRSDTGFSGKEKREALGDLYVQQFAGVMKEKGGVVPVVKWEAQGR